METESGGFSDWLEDTLLSAIEGARERPMLALAIVAGAIGALVGIVIAALVGRRQVARSSSPIERTLRGLAAAASLESSTRTVRSAVERGARKVTGRQRNLLEEVMAVRSAADLVPVAMKLAQNPLVRGYAIRAVARAIKKRTS